MRYKNPDYVNKDARIEVKTTSERILADISDKMQEQIRINRAILKAVGGSLKKEKKDNDEVDLLEERERTEASTVPTNKEKERTETSPVPTSKEKKKWQRKRK